VCWFEGWYRPGALRVKIREDGVVRNKAVYLALAVLPDGTRDILGLWIEQTEGAKFWMKVFNELKTRGTQDVLIAVTDGLKGMEQALNAVFPATTLQTCILHLIRSSLEYASRKERRTVAAALRPIYTAATVEAALAALVQFEQGPWGQRYAPIADAWSLPKRRSRHQATVAGPTQHHLGLGQRHARLEGRYEPVRRDYAERAAVRLFFIGISMIFTPHDMPRPQNHG